MKNLITPLLMATALIATACTNTNDINTPDVDPSGKTPISFVGENSTTHITRAGFQSSTDSYTQLAMHIRSTKSSTEILETRILAKAAHDATNSNTSVSSVSQDDSYIRYWDDAYGRDAKLSVFAIAVPGKAGVTNDSETLEKKLEASTSTWDAKALSETISWTLSPDQSADGVLANEDLTYSNNIKEGGEGGVYEYDYNLTKPDYKTTTTGGVMKFTYKDDTKKDGPGKFDKGHLTFRHALSRITVNLIRGKGFTSDDPNVTIPFEFSTGENVVINGVSTKGDLDLVDGKWTPTVSGGISKMATITLASGAAHSLIAQMLPGFVITGGDNTHNVLEFTIEGNEYSVTHDMMFKALVGKEGTTNVSNTITMEQGKNYVFNITVDKTQISNINASLHDWSDVTATNQNLDNSKGTLSFSKNGSDNNSFDLYRMVDASKKAEKNWGGNYSDKATLTSQTSNGSVFDSNWYYENDESYYHFRSVNQGTIVNARDTDVDDYFDIESGAQNDAHDFHWGAPLLSTASSPFSYSKDDGYAAYINPAFRAITTDATHMISLTEFHMMSNINVIVRTTKTGNAVVLQDASNNNKQCEVALTNFYPKGQVKLGNGLVSITGDLALTGTFTAPELGTEADGTDYIKTKAFTYAVVPQSVSHTSGTIGLTIKTPDGNVYTIKDLSTITISGSSPATAIDFWNPNHSYTYTFTLTKTGISDITCTVVDWITVTAADKNISLE